jgi:signal transduction histidine kinase
MGQLRIPRPLDVALAAVMALVEIVEVGQNLSRVGVVSLALTAIPLAWRREMPFGAMLAVGCGMLLSTVGPDPPEPLTQVLAVLIASYSVAAYAASWQRALAGGAVALVSGSGSEVILGYDIAYDVVFMAALISGAWVAGAVVWRLQLRSSRLEERAAQLDERARTAAANERERIARELHDVVSHSVSLMVVQVGAAEQVLRLDPDQAGRALRAAQATGRSAVEDLRRLLGLLRGAAGEGHSLAPQPGLSALAELAASLSDSGTPIELEGGALPVLPPGIDLAAYRIVQEVVTNAAKHAPGCPTCVRMKCASGSLTINARTIAPPRTNGLSEGTGHGLIGIRERVALYGGQLLEVGFDERADWVVCASIPVAGS